MSSRPFVHLHCHSHYSLLDGAGSLERLVERAKSHGMNALALTDHGNLYGGLQFYRIAKAAGLNPILGYEAYIAPDSRFQKDAGSMKESSYHLTLLAQNQTGFKNLVRLASAAFLEGFYFKPRIDRQILEQYNEGIICLSGCASSQFSRSILSGGGGQSELDAAIQIAEWFQKLFGDRYFIEIQNSGAEIQRLCMEGAVQVATRLGIPLVATNDAHYVDQADAEAQDVMLCINTGKFRADTSRMRMEGDQYFLRNAEEMYAAFPDHEQAVRQSQLIADSVDIELELGRRHFPSFTLPPAKTPENYLRELCVQGLKERYAENEEMCPDGEPSETLMSRLEHELAVINKLGFANYFLIVWDFVRHAREQGIPATARGSGVGSLVSYALYLSHVCPIEHELLFERFLDENRREAPDIDIDFCKERRGEIIRYVKEKYGEQNVAQIGTFGTLAARAAIRDVGRTLSVPLARVNQIVAMVPEELGITLTAALEKSRDLRELYDSDGEVRELVDLAIKIEGLARNVGTHAAAVVIADQPLTEYVPLGRVTGKTEIITQWAMDDVEAAGLLKMDFLGLRNLTILSKAVDLIQQATGERIDPHKFPTDDEETFALLSRGETKGIFQLESGGIRDLLRRMKPDHFRDIIATNALYRPGPLEGGMVDDYLAVKHGHKKATYKHPVMKEVLQETHGVMVYQEQVMRILNRLGGIQLSNAYTCIKAISKKKLPMIAKYRQQFVSGATERGLPKREAEELFGLIEKFAGYGFNKSHSTAYAMIAYMTAYLKAHWPVQFMAALLSGDIPGRNFKKKDLLVEHLEDCQRMNIEVVPPDVSHSDVEFTVSAGKIHFGLSAIKGCGASAAAAIAASRRQDGPFRNLFDFCERLDPAACSRAIIETLIKAGAMDSCGERRSQLMDVVDRALQSGASALADRRSGQKSLFDNLGSEEREQQPDVNLPDIPEFEERERLLMEKEVLGFYLTSHPLAEHEQTFATYCSHTTADISSLVGREEVILGGMLSTIKTAHARKVRAGSTATKYATFDLEDMAGTIRCILWPEDFLKFGQLARPDAILVVRGSVDRRGGGEEANLIVNEMTPLDELASRYTRGVILRLHEADDGQSRLSRLREVLRRYPGNCQLQLLLCLADGSRVRMKSESMRVDVNPEMRDRVEDLLGPGSFQLVTAAPATSRGGPRNGSKRAGKAYARS